MNFIQAKNGSGKIAYYCAEKHIDILDYFECNKKEIMAVISQFGGIILRNFTIRSVSEFNRLANLISPHLIDYINRSTPRTKIGGKIYTATEYPSHKHILFHNENSYSLEWPDLLMFFCVIAPQSGGETPLADSRFVFNKIEQNIIAKFNNKQILYTRNYTPGIDLTWQDVFQTTDKKIVENYCNKQHIQYHWQNQNNKELELTTKQICQATLKHPETNEDVWFNQAHLFHISSLEQIDRMTLLTEIKKEQIPRSVSYGDNSEIKEEDIKHILMAYESEKIVFQWQKGDVMILDNVLMAHARNPFSGDRKIVVAMGKR